MKINLQAVRFREDALIPRYGEQGGLSLYRVRGGNEMPVEHSIVFDTETQLLTIRHLTYPSAPVVHVHASNVKHFEEAPPEVPAEVPAAAPPAPPAPATAPATPAAKGSKAGKIVIGVDDEDAA